MMSVFQQNGSSRWYIRYYHDGTEYRVAGGRTKREAQDRERTIKVELKRGADPDSFAVTRTFKFLADAYQDDPDVKQLVWYPRVRAIAKRLTDMFGMLRITSVKAPAIAKYKARRLEDGIKQSTLNREMSVLRRMFRWGAEQGLVHASNIPTIKTKKESHKIITVSVDDEARLLAQCPKWLSDMVIVAVDTGCRSGELLSIKWGDVDLRAGYVRVKTEKAGGSRNLYMTPRVFKVFSSMPTGLPDVGVFQHPRGKYRVSTLGEAFSNAVKKAGLSNRITFHSLRHTFATRQTQKGTNPFVLMELLGHSTLEMVLRYAHVSDSDLRKAMVENGSD